MFLNLFPHLCTRCLLWRSALLYALRLAVAYPYAAEMVAAALARPAAAEAGAKTEGGEG